MDTNKQDTGEIKQSKKQIFEYMLKFAEYANAPEIKTSNKYKKCIWQLWMQGEENAPEIIKICLNSVRKYAGKRKVILLTEENVKDYVDINSVIWEKYKNGLILPAHFSDYIRLCLLSKYGGTWVDASIMFTDKLPKSITKENFFMYKTAAGMYLDNAPEKTTVMHTISWTCKQNYHLISNWFIHCKKGHIIPSVLLNMYTQCLIQEEVLPDYYIFHILFTIMLIYNEDCRKAYNKMPKCSHIKPVMMQWRMKWTYNQELWDSIVKDSTLHKLTYKYDEVNPESVLAHILSLK